MKKNVLLVVCVLACSVGYTQGVEQTTPDSLGLPVLEGGVGIQEVVVVQGVSEKELYKRAKMFFIERFKSAKDVIQLDDSENGILVGKGIGRATVRQPLLGVSELSFWFQLRIEAKEGRYRYRIDQVRADLPTGEYHMERYWLSPKMSKKVRAAFGEALWDFADSLIAYMKTPKNNDKW